MNKPWPILLLVRKLDHGGCERDLSKVALGLDRSIFEPHVGCFRPEGIRVDELRDGGIPIVQLPVVSFKSRSALHGAMVMRRYMRQHGIALVHAHDVPTVLFATPLARRFGARAVVSSQVSYRTLISPVEHRLLRLVDRFADRVVVNCEAMFDHMVHDEGLPADRPYLCYNGVDPNVFHPAGQPQSTTGELVVGTIANLRPEKGLHLLIEAFAAIPRSDIKLLIVGSGPALEELTSQSVRLGLQNRCTFVPGKPQIAAEMRSIDIFVLPSFSEAFSNALLEAMASGCAVIGSNVGGTPELIHDGTTGLLFRNGDAADLTDKLRRLVEDARLRGRLRGAAAQFARDTFPIARTVGRMADLYRSLLDGSPPLPVRDDVMMNSGAAGVDSEE